MQYTLTKGDFSQSHILVSQDAFIDPSSATLNIKVRPAAELMDEVRKSASYHSPRRQRLTARKMEWICGLQEHSRRLRQHICRLQECSVPAEVLSQTA